MENLTPPPELVQEWHREANLRGMPYEDVADNWAYEQHIANRASQYGANQELEACCKWLVKQGWFSADEHEAIEELRNARRPKPPSLKEQALEALDRMDQFPTNKDMQIIRRALEQLQQPEEEQ